ncbi:MAG: hypothetical protein O0X93_07660, partial [Methanocorpusculum sp.]|nr:hypothetical protein [Methanocorpusculum sp.]
MRQQRATARLRAGESGVKKCDERSPAPQARSALSAFPFSSFLLKTPVFVVSNVSGVSAVVFDAEEF